jgi:CRISPR-associated endonuclease/helicase Cas3
VIAREWFQNAKRALLAPEGVGTVDQALMAALNVKHGFLRFFGLSAKVLVIDEVHAYDAYMTTLLCQLLRWCRALWVPVILLSATLAHEQKKALAEAYGAAGALPVPPPGEAEAYPLLTFVPLDCPARVVPVERDPGRDRSVLLVKKPGLLSATAGTAALAVDLVRDGGCACVLANTVRSAQEIFRELQALNPPDTKLLLFHARFRAEKRQEIENGLSHFSAKMRITRRSRPDPRAPSWLRHRWSSRV